MISVTVSFTSLQGIQKFICFISIVALMDKGSAVLSEQTK